MPIGIPPGSGNLKVEIGEKLAGEVADGQAATPLIGRKQIVARKMQIDRFLGIGAVYDGVHKPQGAFAGDAPTEFRLENGVVD